MPLYTKTLPTGLPVETYTIEKSDKFKQGYERWYVFTIRDASENIVYIYETYYHHRTQLNQGHLYRAAEYPDHCIHVIIAPVSPYQGWNGYTNKTGYRGRPIGLTATSLGTHQVVESPDRKERVPWGPRRFVYGGRQFVWKQEKKNELFKCEDLYEFTKTWPQPGSKTGKKADDGDKQRKVAWGDKAVSSGFFSKWREQLNFLGGVDQVFKEHCLASQCTRLANIWVSLAHEKSY
jgi:hypothetical protein